MTGVRNMKFIIEAEPKEIADLVHAIQSPPLLRIKEPDASTVTEELLKAIGGPIQIRGSEAGSGKENES